MTVHRPGLPQDLPAPEVLWARWSAVAVLEATTEAEQKPPVHRTGCWIDDRGLHLDDCGCTWWTLKPLGGDRFVLFGEDESSGVKWHEPPVDMLAGAPDWIPHDELRELIAGNELGCVYWSENGSWARAPYPADLDDDGLDCGLSRFVNEGELLRELDGGAVLGERRAELVRRAEWYELTPELLETLVRGSGGEPADLPAMLRALRRSGVSHGSPQPAA
ncbi:hypothetical protein ACFVX6_37485 [Streptomyces sp. NPDC058289]|uniref:hypothetical protein n=1 Tax=Streptomyces sp. NPDC058289 TaxID=3346425 RepID=UPI0036EB1A47